MPYIYIKKNFKNVANVKGKLRFYVHSTENVERIRIKDLFKRNTNEENAENKLKICGWIKSIRKVGKNCFAFLDVNDGSYFQNLQIVVDNNIPNFEKLLKTSTDDAIECVGELKRSVGKKQKWELSISDYAKGHYIKLFREEDLDTVGNKKGENIESGEKADEKEQDEEEEEEEEEEEGKGKGKGKEKRETTKGKEEKGYYMISKKYHTKQYLRNFPHLRGRTKLYSSLFRLKSDIIFRTFNFFQKKKFTYINTPILTSNDCEGGSKMFHVTTLFSSIYNNNNNSSDRNSDSNSDSNNDNDNNNNHNIYIKMNKTEMSNMMEAKISGKGRNIFESDFFKTPCYLNVSSQLALECLCCSLGDVFTLNQSFRAENSNTSRHLAEFLMLEIEMAFANLKDMITVAEEYIKYILEFALQKSEEIEYLNKYHNAEIKGKLEQAINQKFVTIPYEEIIHILKKESRNKKVSDIIWGKDLTLDQQKFLANEYFKSPIIVINYPKSIKPFYMKLNEDEKTVACMDIIFPNVGEIAGGSEREIRLPILKQKMEKNNLDMKLYEPYMQLRQYGNVPHAGFGLGIDRLIMFITSIDNIRDLVPFPRYPNSLFM